MSEESTEKQHQLQLSERDLHPRPPDFISSALDFGHAAPTIWCYRLTHCIFIDGAWLELARILSNRIQAGIVVHRAWFLIKFRWGSVSWIKLIPAIQLTKNKWCKTSNVHFKCFHCTSTEASVLLIPSKWSVNSNDALLTTENTSSVLLQ